MGTRHSRAATDDLERRLETWVHHGLITPEQASRIRAIELGASLDGSRPAAGETEPWGSRPPATTREVRVDVGADRPQASLVTGALGYVGGILILIAAGVIAGQYFDDLGRLGRLAVTGSAALALLSAGYLVPVTPTRPAAGRLRSVLWVLAVAATAFFLGLLVDETLGWSREEVPFFAASGTAAVGLELWRRHRWMLQQLAVVVALSIALGSGVATYLGDGDLAPSGVAIWGLGGIWLMLGWGRHVQPRYGTDLLGGAAATVGSQLTMDHDWGAALALATAAALVVVGVRLRALALVAVGSVATLLVVPGVMQRYFPGTLAAPLAVLGAGIVLVLASLATAPKRSRQSAKKSEAALSAMGWMPVAGFAIGVACAVALLALT